MSVTNFSGNTQQENFYPGLIARFLKENDLVPHIHVEGGAITGKYNIPTAYNSASSIQDYAATPSSPQGGQVLKDRKITLGKWMLYQEFLPVDLKQYWQPFSPTGEFVFQQLPQEVQSTFLGLVFNETGSHMSRIGWKGNTALSTDLKYFDGFEKLATTDTGTTQISNATGLTTSNILGELSRALVAARGAKDAFRIASYKPDMKIFMNYKTFELYGSALKALTNKSISVEDATPTRYAGITIVPQAYVSDNAFIFAAGNNSVSSNMWMAVNSVQDDKTLIVEKLQANSEKFFAKMVVSAGVQFVRPEEVAIYKY